MFRKHLIKIALFFSLLIHFLFFLSFSWIGHLQLFPSSIAELLNNKKEEEKRLVFELVETPDDARSEKAPEDASLLSDKNARARDQYQNKDLPNGDPYSEGDFDFKNLPATRYESAPYEQGSNERESRERSDLSKREASKESSTKGYEYEKFSRQKLLESSPSSQSGQRSQNLQRPLYDNRKFNADELGGLSFNTYNWDFAPYMLEMKRKVERNVFPPPAFTYMGLISGETLLRFRVLPNGEVKELTVLKYVGHESLKETSVQAISISSPFKPLPADFPEDYLEVTASFHYYIKR